MNPELKKIFKRGKDVGLKGKALRTMVFETCKVRYVHHGKSDLIYAYAEWLADRVLNSQLPGMTMLDFPDSAGLWSAIECGTYECFFESIVDHVKEVMYNLY